MSSCLVSEGIFSFNNNFMDLHLLKHNLATILRFPFESIRGDFTSDVLYFFQELVLPTLLITGPYRIYFFSHEPNEPTHVHVDRDNQSAKFWLEPVSLARSIGFSAKELNRIQQIVEDHRQEFVEAWHGYFGTSS